MTTKRQNNKNTEQSEAVNLEVKTIDELAKILLNQYGIKPIQLTTLNIGEKKYFSLDPVLGLQNINENSLDNLELSSKYPHPLSGSFTSSKDELKIEINKITAELNNLKEILYGNAIDFGSDVKEQLIPINIYIDNDKPEVIFGVYEAVSNYVKHCGFEKIIEFEAIKGSWIKRLIAKSVGAIPKEEITNRLREAEYIIEVNSVLKPQSEVDKNQSEALLNILNSIKDVNNSAIRIGSLLVVKVTTPNGEVNVQVRTLTIKELHILNKKPELLHQPKNILRALTDAIEDEELGRTDINEN